MDQEYTLRELSKEEGIELTKDLQEVLKKHDSEMSVTSTITLLKRVPVTKEDGDENKKTTNSEAEESGESDSGEPTQG